jgi:hypothetical protein
MCHWIFTAESESMRVRVYAQSNPDIQTWVARCTDELLPDETLPRRFSKAEAVMLANN